MPKKKSKLDPVRPIEPYLRPPVDAENLEAMAAIIHHQLEDSYGADGPHIKFLAASVADLAKTLAAHLRASEGT